jgi:DMSO reductase anchor subunit
MCHGRLSVGEAPACVQACPTQAIRITVVNATEVSQRLSAGHFLPNSPPSAITKPTTIYHSALPLPTPLASPSHEQVQPQHAHWALVAMLVLTQLSVGAATTGGLSLLLWGQSALHALGLSLISGIIGLMAATAHLGRPHLAFRGVLGWRHSWLSREVIAFGLFMGSLCLWMAHELFVHASLEQATMSSSEVLAFLTVGMGWAGAFCSARIYQFTQREFWRGSRTSVKFLLTTLLFAEATTLLCFAAEETRAAVCHTVIRVFVLTLLVKLTYESTCGFSKRSHGTVLAASHYLMWQPLRTVTVARWTMAGMTVVAALMLSVAGSVPGGKGGEIIAIAWSMLVLLLVGELLERWLFFAAVVPWRMPGGRCA